MSSNISTSGTHVSFCQAFISLQDRVNESRRGAHVVVDGQTLSIGDVVAVARHGVVVQLSSDPTVREDVNASRKAIESKLAEGKSVYGLTTGFGGSADTRTMDSRALGKSLLQHLHIGVLPPTPSFKASSERKEEDRNDHLTVLSISGDPLANVMPEAWVRAATLIRMNSLIRGHSGVRWEFIEGLNNLLRENITPVVPLRGSVSASGDLSPLSYIAGTLIGNPRIRVFDGPTPCLSDLKDGFHASRKIVSCTKAYQDHGLNHLVFEAKEHLGVLNGTAFSAGVASLVLSDALQLAILAMVCTAMGTEALLGTQASHATFIHATARPHPGQVEVAHTIYQLLEGSSFAHLLSGNDEEEEECSIREDAGRLRQDRYPLRTAPQFLGPQLEDIRSALNTVTIECNSTTDNPLVDPKTGQVHHGGNFQAMSVTNSMEATRLALHHIGKLLFSQMTELLNPLYNRGLPPSLAASDPSINYFAKGLDTAAASYVSELGWLAGNVSTHIQSAEMHNQAVNSLALISARATVTALDVLSMLIASYLVVLCQALDLRALQCRLFDSMRAILKEELSRHFAPYLSNSKLLDLLCDRLEPITRTAFDGSTTRDAHEQMDQVAAACSTPLIDFLDAQDCPSPNLVLHKDEPNTPLNVLGAITSFRRSYAARCSDGLRGLRVEYLEDQSQSGPEMNASPFLAQGTLPMYDFIRSGLGVKMRGVDNLHQFRNDFNEPLVGDDVSVVYQSIRNGKMANVLAQLLKDLKP